MDNVTKALPVRPPIDYHSTVDTSRPFSSVKEAVAIFGEKFLVGEIYSPKPFTFPKQETPWKFSPSPKKDEQNVDEQNLTKQSLVKLEAELEETKMELKLLKERETETHEVTLASLNAELLKNTLKIAQSEAAKAVVEDGLRDEERRIVRMEASPTLDQILSNINGENEGSFGGKKKERKIVKKKKKKPIIPLVGDLFSRRKGSSTTLHNPLYSSSHYYM